jgi:hypothetical protein
MNQSANHPFPSPTPGLEHPDWSHHIIPRPEYTPPAPGARAHLGQRLVNSARLGVSHLVTPNYMLSVNAMRYFETCTLVSAFHTLSIQESSMVVHCIVESEGSTYILVWS